MDKDPYTAFECTLGPGNKLTRCLGNELAVAIELCFLHRFGSSRRVSKWFPLVWTVKTKLGNLGFVALLTQSPYKTTEWILAIGPLDRFLIGRLFQRKSFECTAELKQIAREVHAVLVEKFDVSALR